MRRPTRLRLLTTGITLAMLAPALLSGCADNESSLFIAGVLVPSNECVFDPSAGAALRFNGVLDLAFSDVYFAGLQIGNQLLPRGDPNKLRTETARILIRGAVVSVRTADGTVLSEYTTNATGFADPARGENPGWGATVVALTPSGLLDGSIEEINVAVSVFGDTLGGDEIESNTLTYPIFVCTGCLVDCSTALSGTGECSTTEQVEAVCLPGQDEATPCQYSIEVRNGGEPCAP